MADSVFRANVIIILASKSIKPNQESNTWNGPLFNLIIFFLLADQISVIGKFEADPADHLILMSNQDRSLIFGGKNKVYNLSDVDLSTNLVSYTRFMENISNYIKSSSLIVIQLSNNYSDALVAFIFLSCCAVLPAYHTCRTNHHILLMFQLRHHHHNLSLHIQVLLACIKHGVIVIFLKSKDGINVSLQITSPRSHNACSGLPTFFRSLLKIILF